MSQDVPRADSPQAAGSLTESTHGGRQRATMMPATMRAHPLAVSTSLLLTLAALVTALPPAGGRGAPRGTPCTSGHAACASGPAGRRGAAFDGVPVAPARRAQSAIRRAVVMVARQGATPTATSARRFAAAFLAGALDDTIVVALKFTSRDGSCEDALAEHEVNWPCSGNSWRAAASRSTTRR